MRNYKTNLFQKRHYEWLAETIKNLDIRADAHTGVSGLDEIIRERIAHEFAKALKGTNPNYDYQRFMDAAMDV